jgi:hypothetical protein
MKTLDLRITLTREINKNGHEMHTAALLQVTKKGTQEIATVTSSRDYAAITGVLQEARNGVLGKMNEVQD